MTNLRDILANNLKEARRKLGISQAKLAEKAAVSTQFVAMIELSRQFPTPEVLDRLAAALGLEAYQLFSAPLSPEIALEKLHDSLVNNLEKVVSQAVKEAISAPPRGFKGPPPAPTGGKDGTKLV